MDDLNHKCAQPPADSPAQADGPASSADQAVAFLAALFAEGDLILGRPTETWIENGAKQRRVIYEERVYAKAPRDFKAFYKKLGSVGVREKANAFFGVCPRLGAGGQFDLAWQVRVVRVLWADIDHLSVTEALKRVADAGLPPPSIVVSSGNGVHLYWLLDEPFRIDDAGDPPPLKTEWVERNGKREPRKYFVDPSGERIDVKKKHLCPRLSPKALHIQDILKGLAAKIGGDHTTDLVRLLRLPGTPNRKDERNGKPPVPCTLVELQVERRYPLAQFAALALDSPDKKRREKIAQQPLPAVRKKLTPAKEDRLNAAIAQSQVADVGARSEADFAVCCVAIRGGMAKDQLWTLVQGIGKFNEDGEAYFARTWDAAADEVRETIIEKREKKTAAKERKETRTQRIQQAVQAAGLPTIEIDVDEARVATEAIAALAKRGNIYQRSGTLAHIVTDSPPPACIKRPDGGLRIAPLPQPRLRELLTLAAILVRDAGEAGLLPCHPQEWLVRAIDARGEWPDIPPLEAIVETPVLLADGTILQTAGYDLRSGLYLSPAGDFPPVQEQPTRIQVEQARDLLLEVVTDFPFQAPCHQAAWLAAMLTPAARHAFEGPCPLFAVDANVRGSGKTMLCDAIGIVYTGRLLPRTGAPKDDEEARKKITSIALAAEPHVLIDNITGTLGCSSLDAALTATSWSDRILGKSQMTGAIPLSTIWFATGNNLVFTGDTPRRTLPIRLQSHLEKPEERKGFRHPDLLTWVREERTRLAVAALTILRGYLTAGRPDMKLKAWGSFEEWSRLVRHAVVWCGLKDPGATRLDLTEDSDGQLQLLRLLMTGWAQADPQRKGMTAGDAVNRSTESHCGALREAFAQITSPGEPPNLRSIGMQLHHFKQRVCGGRRFIRENGRTGAIWKIEQIGESAEGVAHRLGAKKRETNGTSGTIPQLRGKSKNHKVRTHQRMEEGGNSPASPASLADATPCNHAVPDPAGLANVSCDGLHVQPQVWVRRKGKSYCPQCGKFMGNARSAK